MDKISNSTSAFHSPLFSFGVRFLCEHKVATIGTAGILLIGLYLSREYFGKILAKLKLITAQPPSNASKTDQVVKLSLAPSSITAKELLKQMDNYQAKNGSIVNFPWPSLNIEGDLNFKGSYIADGLYSRRFNGLTSLPQALHVSGDLDLSDYTELTALPQDLHVGGSLNFYGCTGLKSLPQDLYVGGGSLNLHGCTGLTSLPQGLRVSGGLDLSNCTGLTSLPQDSYGGYLDLRGCTGLTSLPHGLRVGGNLNLSDLEELTSLPQDLYVGGDLDLSGRKELTSLSQGLRVSGNLNLHGCDGLTALPQGLHVDGNLDLSFCKGLTSLPQGLHIGDSLNLRGCDGLTSLPQGLHVGGNLYLDCDGLTSLPQGLYVGGNLCLDCDGLTSLPQGLYVGGELNLSGHMRLTSLPQDLYVGGKLNLSCCTRLASLSQNLHVGGNLNLHSCAALRSLPQGLHVGGNLDLSGCTQLTSLPTWITTLGPRADGQTREVDLTGTSLSEQIIQILQQTNAPGMQFHTSQAASIPTKTFDHLDKALDFWIDTSKDSSLKRPCLNFTEHVKKDVITFLSRLITETEEYKNLASRPLLAKRVISAFQCMQEDDGIQTRAIYIIHVGLDSCGDRIISALGEIELMIRIYELEKNGGSEEALKKAGKSFLLLDMVNKKAKAHIKTLPYVDEIEVYLAFQIGLAQRFDLPISTRHMIFRRCAQISDGDIAEIGDDIEKAYSGEELDKFLKTWSPWIVHQRRLSVPTYETLPEANYLLEKEAACLITQDPPKAPVLYKGNVYEFEAFARWFVQKGTDPMTREVIDITQLKRVQSID